MGTRARIAIKNAHWDGYPSHHGPILLEAYTTPEKVRALIELGDLSTLGRNLGEKHDFDTDRPDDTVTAYGRDRGETGIEPKTSDGLEELVKLTQDSGGEYLYVFDDGVWYVAGDAGFSAFGMPSERPVSGLKKLADVLKEPQ